MQKYIFFLLLIWKATLVLCSHRSILREDYTRLEKMVEHSLLNRTDEINRDRQTCPADNSKSLERNSSLVFYSLREKAVDSETMEFVLQLNV